MLYIYIYIYIYIHIYIYIYIYIYIVDSHFIGTKFIDSLVTDESFIYKYIYTYIHIYIERESQREIYMEGIPIQYAHCIGGTSMCV